MPYFLRSGPSNRSLIRTLDVRPDDTDARDYIFQPSLRALPSRTDHRGLARVLDQGSEGACVGFALATVVNVGLGRMVSGSTRPRRVRSRDGVSPRMLYEMGRRYDEWQGENYEGTSLRGAMKGWHKHGVTTTTSWPYLRTSGGKRVPDRQFGPERAREAARRPIGAYYRIVDSDVGHVQAAIVEGDAVLASAWIHRGWLPASLGRPRDGLRVIQRVRSTTGLHAFAIVGHTPNGFIVQNSWGPRWGSHGYALLPYDDWFENRQDAWVARPGPETRDSTGEPRIFVVDFVGGRGGDRAGTTVSGLELDPEAIPYLVNTGDRGALSADGLVGTRREDLAGMAERVLLSSPLVDGNRHVVLYAHGGLNAEASSAVNAGRIWGLAKQRRVPMYFFVWESGITESVLGWLASDDDAGGPTRFSWQNAWERIKSGTRAAIREAQRALGAGLAPVVREVFWGEMKGRARGASTPNGGAALFAAELFRVFARLPNDRYTIHLVAHSAGSIYLAHLYRQALQGLLQRTPNAVLGSVHFLAPAITVADARAAFLADGRPAVPPVRFHVHTLRSQDEENDSIQIYPSSLLTYVADHLEDASRRVPLLGIREDFTTREPVTFATQVDASASVRHGEFDDAGHEIEGVLAGIGRAQF